MTDTTNIPDAPKGPTLVRASRANLAKVLPTDRVSYEKQSAILRAYTAASGRDKKAVTNDEVAAVMSGLAASSISICNPFFSDVGLLVQEGRKLRPVDAVFDLQHAHEWNPDTAGAKLRAVFSDHWAAKALVPKLAFRQLSKDEAISFLAEESKAEKGHRKSLEILLDFLDYAAVIRVEGNAVMKAGATSDTPVDDDNKGRESKNNDDGLRTPPPPPADPNRGNPVADHDPMIVGLFKKLPPADSSWETADRIKWLKTAANIFGLIYESSGQPDEISISVPKGRAANEEQVP